MDAPLISYCAYTAFFLLLAGSAVIVPLMAFGSDMQWAYDAFEPTCHQKLSRSLCVFSGDGGTWIADCTPQGMAYVNDFSDREAIRVAGEGGSIGYKMPYCSRDFGIYAAMLLGALAYPLVRRLDERAMYPAIWLLLSVVPIAIDGGLQLATELDRPLNRLLLGTDENILPFEYESTNAMRLATGAIAGFAASFYAIPILVNLFSRDNDAPEAARRRVRSR